jgi:hypothetical protein
MTSTVESTELAKVRVDVETETAGPMAESITGSTAGWESSATSLSPRARVLFERLFIRKSETSEQRKQ